MTATNLSTLTDYSLAQCASALTDLDAACLLIQKALEIPTGDYAGLYFSHPIDDADALDAWPTLDAADRATRLRNYIAFERAAGSLAISRGPNSHPMSAPDRMMTRPALEYAKRLVEMHAECLDTASPDGHRARLALTAIEDVLAQMGTEHIEPLATDLCRLCDILIHG
jgi:hypothetical protein